MTETEELHRSGLRRRLGRPVPIRAAVAAALGVVAVLVALVATTSDLGRSRASNVAQLLAAGLASGVAARAARRAAGAAPHRWLLAAAAASWCAGQSVWTVVQWNGRPPPFPSIADAGFLATYPLLIVGFLRSPSSRVRRGTFRAALDWTTVTGSVVFVAWAAGLETMLRSATWSSSSALAIAYPLLDVVVLSVLLAVITRCRSCRQSGAVAVAVGIGLLAVADSAFSYLSAHDAYSTGSWVDLVWIAAWLVLAAATAGSRDELPDQVEPMRGFDAAATWAPVLALGAVVASGVALQLSGRPFADDPLLFWLGVALFVVNIVRFNVAHGDAVAATTALNLQLVEHTERVEEYDAALRHAGTRMWRWDPSSGRIAWSPPPDGSAVTAADHRPGYLAGFVASLHAEDRDAVTAVLAAAVADRAAHELTYRLVLDGGEQRWLRTSARYRERTPTKPGGVLGLEVDVTAERLATVRDARRLREAEALVSIGDRALRADEAQVFLHEVAAIVHRAIPAPLSAVLRIDDAGLLVAAGVGWREGTVGHAVLPAIPGLPRGDAPAAGTGPVQANLLRDHDIRSGVSATIRTERGPWGVVAAHSTVVTDFDDDDALFLAAVANLVGTAIDRLDGAERLRRHATHDDLTGLPNRALLLDRLATIVETGRRNGHHAAVVHVGIDRFGLVNETYGHEAGDALLVDVAARLRDVAPQGATVARFGGDEFVLAALCAGPDDAADLAAEVLAAVQAPSVTGDPPEEVFLSASCGLALASGFRDPALLLRNAAAATAAAHALGGGRYEIHDPRLRARAVGRLAEERDLRRGLDAGEFVAFFQPVVDLQTGHVVGVEALARWLHPTRGLLRPLAFLDRVAEVGLANRLGEAMLGSALSAAVTWPLPGGFSVAVNVAADQLAGDTLRNQLREALAASGFDPEHLVLEVVEDQLTAIGAVALALAEIKRELPVRVHLDDFGVGHSSLARLHALPIDGLKIDRAFVHDAAARVENEVIVSTVIALARALGLHVVAEGVETEPQRAMLLRLGCSHGQGWLFAPALPAADIPALLATGCAPGRTAAPAP